MLPDQRDTIVAIASPPGGALRGVVRVSGPEAIGCVARCVESPDRVTRVSSARLVEALRLPIQGLATPLLVDAMVWPDARSYTGQPSVELHLPGSPPLLAAVVERLIAAGARTAQPGEFTLRAVLAGRIDLVQAEAVLGVIDARGDAGLRAALVRLAGGLSHPLAELRETLLMLLAELEAGLDFVEEEDVRFIEPAELAARLTAAQQQVAALGEQLARRGEQAGLPRVLLTGPPNAGKSSLLNALAERYAESPGGWSPALVSDQAGTTRDAVVVPLNAGGLRWELVDSAGRTRTPLGEIDAVAQRLAQTERDEADLILYCYAEEPIPEAPAPHLAIATKCDARPSIAGAIATSAHTGAGLAELVEGVVERLRRVDRDEDQPLIRCRESLQEAQTSLSAALALAATGADELTAAELRAALDALGRVTGVVVTDDVLDRVFSKFCIGK
ncbi:tRNA modification GTPase MnmE [Pirellulimonas nuda]|uniref:tRNA modification GTPase MnmE n=1 Tax=Pirellulimonas nuda TaxID=2528009 RepID=A0A518DEN8_9BACT|nr:GTPase [Pirellulimonas nuda]QDU89939.1 tRNA modification GTPase MnmE [Pirellulimonas nuda]